VNCKNCNTKIEQIFCPICGQKTNTKRYVVKSALFVDAFQNLFEVNKGLVYTIKELFSRPGNSIREYIQGKRIRHRNYIELLLIVIAFSYFLEQYASINSANLVTSESIYEGTNSLMRSFVEFSNENPKLYMLLMIPLNALFSFIWFQRSKQNYIEHLILNTYKSSAEVIITILFIIITILYSDIAVLKIILGLFSTLVMAYSVWFYYQYFSDFDYKRWKLLGRSFLAAISSQISVGLIIALLGSI